MAYQTRVLTTTFEVNQDLSQEQFKAVVLDSDAKIGLPTIAGELAVGILQEDPLEGEYGGVMVYGISKAVYGETISAGQEVAVDEEGKMKVSEAGDISLGIAVIGAGADEIGTILLANRNQIAGLGEDYSTFNLPVDFSNIADAQSLLDDYEFGFTGYIEKVSLIVTDPTTDTNSEGATLTITIDGSNLDGGVLEFVNTDVNSLGAVVEGSEIVGDNQFEVDDNIQIMPSDVTTFTDGKGIIVLTLKTELEIN